MKKIIIKLLFIIPAFLVINSSFLIHTCQSQWIVQPFLIMNRAITDIEFVDSLNGWAIINGPWSVDTAYILHTTNGGNNWYIQKSYPETASLTAFYIVNDTVGYIIAGFPGAAIIKTSNGGINWIIINFPVTTVLDNIFFLNPDSGFVCGSGLSGSGSGIWFTSNGGLSWVLRNSGLPTESPGARVLFFFDSNTGWCGDYYGLYNTSNGGMSWNFNHSAWNEPNPYSIYFINHDTGFVGFGNAGFAKTNNGGINWTFSYMSLPGGETILDIAFLNKQVGWACSAGYQKIYKTTNSGYTWGYQVLPAGFPGAGHISIVDSNNIWISAYGVAKTTNGGGNFISNVSFVNENIVKFKLNQNYPNPFNSSTIINYTLSENVYISLKIYNILGREIKALVNEYKSRGDYSVRFDANALPGGVYFYSLIAGKYKETKSMLLVK